MKINHVVKRSLLAPQPGKVYGAKIEAMSLNKSSVTIEWAIFARKPRSKPPSAKGAKK